MIVTDDFIIVLVIYELCQYLLDAIQSRLLSFGRLLLSLHTPREIITMVVVSHVGDAVLIRSVLTVVEEA